MKIVDYRGIEGLYAAEVLTDNEEGITFGEPRQLCAVSTLSKSTSTSSATKYYNNRPAIITRSVGGDEVSIDASAISEQDQAWLMGEYYDEETGLYVEGEPELKYFAIGYITKKTDGSEMLVWRLKGTFGYPQAEHATENDGTDSSGNTLTFSGVNTLHKFDKIGKTAKAVNLPAEKYAAGKDKFFETVQTPDTLAAV
jgi:phi13 family phage major tail protein